MTRQTVTFDSAGTTCEAWHFEAAHNQLANAAGRPVVVMAHGLAGTKDSGLEPFARAFAAAGLDVFLFDYRGFGASGGELRQVVSLDAQIDDYRAAMRAAATLPGVDRDRLVVWGVSLAGGHVLCAGADRPDVAAVVALIPMVDGIAAGRHALATHTSRELLRATALGVRSKVSRKRGRGPMMMPVVGKPGDLATFNLPGALEDYLAIAGPTWRNEIAADVGLELSSRKPQAVADKVTAPLLVQIADFDQSAPPQAAAKAAFKGKAEVRHYPCDHFDVFEGKPWHEAAVKHAVAFLTRHLSVGQPAAAVVEPAVVEPAEVR